MLIQNNINFRTLYYFVKVVEMGGFNQAQAVLHISVPTISNHVAKLEQDLGFRLCQRGRDSFTLTQNGEKFYASAVQFLQQANDFWVENMELKNSIEGVLGIGCMDMTYHDGNNKISEILAIIKNNALTDVHFQLDIMPSPTLESMVINGDLHLAICFGSNQNDSLDYIPLYKERSYLCCGHTHPLFTVDDADIDEAVLSAYPRTHRAYAIDDDDTPRTALSNSMEGHFLYMQSGQYLSILPNAMITLLCDDGRMKRICPNTIFYDNDICLVISKSKKKSRLLLYVIQVIFDVYHVKNPFSQKI